MPRMHTMLNKQLFFVMVSGIGWLMDCSIYWLCTEMARVPVDYANMLSSIPAVTFVFIFSTRKIFKNNINRVSLQTKYFLYLVYQILLIVSVSFLMQFIYQSLSGIDFGGFLNQHMKLGVKLLVTPATLLSNFYVMKVLVEKL